MGYSPCVCVALLVVVVCVALFRLRTVCWFTPPNLSLVLNQISWNGAGKLEFEGEQVGFMFSPTSSSRAPTVVVSSLNDHDSNLHITSLALNYCSATLPTEHSRTTYS